MDTDASDLARRLADDAEAVCRRYLSNGVREGRAWRIGDVRNTPGRSMYVRLMQDGMGRPAGKWTDAATGEHGDLLDVIRESCGLTDFRDVLAEARRFLALPRPDPPPRAPQQPAPQGSPEAAQRLFAAACPLRGTLADAYLRARGIVLSPADQRALRFHPRCFYWPDEGAPKQSLPAMIARVTDGAGAITGVHRTWLHSGLLSGLDAGAPPSVLDRRAMGFLLGHGVRIGSGGDVAVAGEGIETTLSLRSALPALPLIAALSAAHLGALLFPPGLRRLYVARDDDAAGDHAFTRLSERGAEAGVEIIGLRPLRDDFNSDLRDLGPDHLRRLVRTQLAAADASAFVAG
jgi:hypothetical protein